MPDREFRYRWEWNLRAPPEALWDLVADTNRFNRDTGLPEVHRISIDGGRQRLAMRVLGMTLEWDEYPFEWIRPYHYSILRRFHTGPVSEILATADLESRPEGGTRLVYSIRAEPRNWVGTFLIPWKIGRRTRARFEETFRAYDHRLSAVPAPAAPSILAPQGEARLSALEQELKAQGADPALLERLIRLMTTGDDLTLSRIRPYVLADSWNVDRRRMLELCLRATREGLLDARWDLLCPLCRGAKKIGKSLADLDERGHCDACDADFVASFDRSVEVTFRPNPAVRRVEFREYCIGGPQLTPHIVSQNRVAAGGNLTVRPGLDTQAYRVRALGVAGWVSLRVREAGRPEASIRLDPQGWPSEEAIARPDTAIRLFNATAEEKLFIVERAEWSAQAATAADVTTLQLFRDLFGREALRPDVRLGIESLTVLFTDLSGSTHLYRTIGDAPAFGRVMAHFDLLRSAVDAEGGSLVKTMGDAVLAVFRRPACALRAFLAVQRALAQRKERPSLVLKGGLHAGPVLAVNQNDRLDYFGSTVNIASRLESLAGGSELVLSDSAATDPEMRDILARDTLEAARFESEVRGFEGKTFSLWRIRNP